MARRRKPLLHLIVKNTAGHDIASYSARTERGVMKMFIDDMRKNTHLTTRGIGYTKPTLIVATVGVKR